MINKYNIITFYNENRSQNILKIAHFRGVYNTDKKRFSCKSEVTEPLFAHVSVVWGKPLCVGPGCPSGFSSWRLPRRGILEGDCLFVHLSIEMVGIEHGIKSYVVVV